MLLAQIEVLLVQANGLRHLCCLMPTCVIVQECLRYNFSSSFDTAIFNLEQLVWFFKHSPFQGSANSSFCLYSQASTDKLPSCPNLKYADILTFGPKILAVVAFVS